MGEMKEKYRQWKERHVIWEEFRYAIWTCRWIREAEAQVKFNSVGDVEK